MRFISKSAIVINTESLFTLTSKWHHYPPALTCFEELGLIHPKWKESLSASSGLSLEFLEVGVPASSTYDTELHAVESFSLSVDCAQWGVMEHVLTF